MARSATTARGKKPAKPTGPNEPVMHDPFGAAAKFWGHAETDVTTKLDAISAAFLHGHEAFRDAYSMLLAAQMGLMAGTTRHINARVPARLLEAATERAGTDAVTEVVTRALASLATRSEIGPWLAEHWGELRDVDPAVAAEIDDL